VTRDNMGHATVGVTQIVYNRTWWEESVEDNEPVGNEDIGCGIVGGLLWSDWLSFYVLQNFKPKKQSWLPLEQHRKIHRFRKRRDHEVCLSSGEILWK